ncbi:MAG TPA: TRIC cation channel family protein [Thermomicrobiales bacterium]|nr:TRIC cation channel family protein [Thermomicrobiales bacterium]
MSTSTGLNAPFQLPLYIDYAATFLWAISGALVAARQRFDVAGVAGLALVTAAGGGILRDGLFIQQGPPRFVQSPAYITIIVLAAAIVLLAGQRVNRWKGFDTLVALVDSAALAAYGLVGLSIARNAGLSLPAAIFVGIVNAVGGGVLRDVLVGRTPEVFRPGVPTAIAAFVSCLIFLGLTRLLGLGETIAALIAIGTVFALRATALQYNLHTRPAPGFD